MNTRLNFINTAYYKEINSNKGIDWEKPFSDQQLADFKKLCLFFGFQGTLPNEASVKRFLKEIWLDFKKTTLSMIETDEVLDACHEQYIDLAIFILTWQTEQKFDINGTYTWSLMMSRNKQYTDIILKASAALGIVLFSIAFIVYILIKFN